MRKQEIVEEIVAAILCRGGAVKNPSCRIGSCNILEREIISGSDVNISGD